MIWFKSCPRCGGDLVEERSIDAIAEITCLQCARTLDARQRAGILGGRRPRSNEGISLPRPEAARVS